MSARFTIDRLGAQGDGVANTESGQVFIPFTLAGEVVTAARERDRATLMAVSFGGGQVDITSGKFVFGCTEAYMIEDGKVTRPIKGAMLIGNGPDAMHRVSMVGNDTKLDTGIGNCGKAGQWVPVGVGQPHLRMNQMTVGGTQV